MSDRHLPVRPNLDQLKHQAKDLLREIQRGDAAAAAELLKHHPEQLEPAEAQLADAQLALARSYGLPSWPRLVLACRMTDAIWRDDLDTVRELVVKHPHLLHEDARGVKGNWGPPMSYAANLGRDRIIAMLHELGAADLSSRSTGHVSREDRDRAAAVRDGRAAGAGFRDGTVRDAERRRARLAARARREITDEHGDRLAPVAMCSRRTAVTRRASTRASRCRPARHRAAGHAADGACTAAASTCSSGTCAATRAALADVHARGDLSAGAGLSRRRFAGAARDAARRRDAAAPLRRLRRDRDRALAAGRGARRQRASRRRCRRLRRPYGALRLRGVAAARRAAAETTSSRGSCSTMARTRTCARRCASGCGSWTTRRCTNTAT